MRIFIVLLSVILVAAIVNTTLYAMSDDYRFFVKKIKYGEEPVISTNVEPQTNIPSSNLGDESISIEDIFSSQSDNEPGVTFLDVFTKKKAEVEEVILKELPDLTGEEQKVRDMFLNNFDLAELLIETRLYSLTTEYPDPYHEYYSSDLSLYIFSTKSYDDVKKVLELVSEEDNFSLNETNTFGEASLFLNTNDNYERNEQVRILFEYQNKAFGLKIKKDQYNTIKSLLENL